MGHKIYTRNDQKKEPLAPSARALVRRAVTAALAYEHFAGQAEVSVTFVDNERIRELNREYRGKDSATDVLSFPLSDGEEGEFDIPMGEDTDGEAGYRALGDIVISVERARTQAEEYGHSFERELAFLAVHSTLHLLGYDHERSDEEDADQRRRQEEILAGMDLRRD